MARTSRPERWSARRRLLQGIIFAVVFPLTFVSSAFVPTDSHARLARVVRRSPADDAGHERGPGSHPGINVYDAELSAIAWSVGILVVAFPLGIWLYNRRTTQ